MKLRTKIIAHFMIFILVISAYWFDGYNICAVSGYILIGILWLLDITIDEIKDHVNKIFKDLLIEQEQLGEDIDGNNL